MLSLKLVVLLLTCNFVKSIHYQNCECGVVNDFISDRIVGGWTTRPHEFPWTAAIDNQGSLHCGGALINDRYILTAGHCVRWILNLNNLSVILGMHRRKPSDGKEVEISDVFIHKNFKSHKLYDDNDIALIRLQNAVKFDKKILPVCLPKIGKTYYRRTATVAGWGKESVFGKPANILKETRIRILTPAGCRNTSIGDFITNTVLCGYESGTDACQGDSGGPLIYEREPGKIEQIGIVSWGLGCATPDSPGVYTDVTKYIDWIYANTEDALYCTN